MKNIVLACSTLKYELRKAIEETGKEYPVLWVDSTLHAYPEKLKKYLQEEIDRIENVDNILFVYGSCGNALIGLKSHITNLVIPKFDDCISMLLCKNKNQNAQERSTDVYYLTRGWMESERGILQEYNHCVEKYGYKRAKKVFLTMLNNYNYLLLIDTGAYDIEEYIPQAQEIAEKIQLELKIEQGTIRLIKKLLTGPWDEEFILVPPDNSVELHHFGFEKQKLSKANFF